jgi:hypothetical protein
MKILILVLVLLGNIYHCSGQDDIRHIVDSLDRQVRLSFDKRDSIDLNKIEKIVRVRDSAEKEIIRLLDSFITNEANYCTVMELVDGHQTKLFEFMLSFWISLYWRHMDFRTFNRTYLDTRLPIFYYLAGNFNRNG